MFIQSITQRYKFLSARCKSRCWLSRDFYSKKLQTKYLANNFEFGKNVKKENCQLCAPNTCSIYSIVFYSYKMISINLIQLIIINCSPQLWWFIGIIYSFTLSLNHCSIFITRRGECTTFWNDCVHSNVICTCNQRWHFYTRLNISQLASSIKRIYTNTITTTKTHGNKIECKKRFVLNLKYECSSIYWMLI